MTAIASSGRPIWHRTAPNCRRSRGCTGWFGPAVTNLSANRIRDLDIRKVQWRVFYDINLVNIDYRPFDASTWPVRESGLLGPVTVQGVEGGIGCWQSARRRA